MLPQLNKSWIDAARKVVKESSYTYIDITTNEESSKKNKNSTILDGVTANMLVKIYDSLNDDNKKKFGYLPILQAVKLGWSLV